MLICFKFCLRAVSYVVMSISYHYYLIVNYRQNLNLSYRHNKTQCYQVKLCSQSKLVEHDRYN